MGAGESGKSTFAKQMRILHLSGFTDSDRQSYGRMLQANMIENMLALLNGARKLGIEVKDTEAAQKVLAKDDFEWSDFADLSSDIHRLWLDPGIQEAYSQSSKFHLCDNCMYLMKEFDRLRSPNVVPTDQDILRCRHRTTGVIETTFEIGEQRFRMVDVGGQRSERRKWINCFENVSAIIFFVSLAEYNLMLEEDETVLRIEESANLFRQLITNRWFSGIDVLLFLNKIDLFQEKIKHIPLTVAYPSYSGPQEYEPSAHFIRKKFEALNDNPKRVIYSSLVCATDSKNIAIVFNSVSDILLRKNLEKAGFSTADLMG